MKGGEEKVVPQTIVEGKIVLPVYTCESKSQWQALFLEVFKNELNRLFVGENGIIQQVSRCLAYAQYIPDKLREVFKRKPEWRSFRMRFNDAVLQYRGWCVRNNVNPAF